MNKEIWKDITGYEGLYQVSSDGRVKSLERYVPDWRGGDKIQKERILKPIVYKDGYLYVNLYANGKQKKFLVHRLVCTAFHDNSKSKQQVKHINGNKTDNRAVNLEWCPIGKQIIQYTLDGELIKIWPSTMEVERQIGFFQSSICNVANGKCKQAYGFIWKYVEGDY